MGIKVKKTAQQLIDDIFKPKGVTFQKCTESDALIYLEDKNYYYKFASYRHNFNKDEQGKYLSLDFGDLIEISKLDKRIRFVLLKMCLEIEHAVKTNLLKNISYNDDVDGYQIVEDFICYYNSKTNSSITKSEIIKRGISPSSSAHQLYMKLKDDEDIAIWQLVEFLYVSELPYLFEYYYHTYPMSFLNFINNHRMDFPKNLRKEPINDQAIKTYVKKIRTLFKNANAVRNNSAHNNALLICLNTKPQDATQTRNHSGELYVNDRYNNYYLRRHFKKLTLDLYIQASYRFLDLASVIKLYELFCVTRNDSTVTELLTVLNEAPSYFTKYHNESAPFMKSLTNFANEIFKQEVEPSR